jgi:hypothetical protein
MRYLVPYTILRRDLREDQQTVSAIQKLLLAVPLDEEWYLQTYPDGATSISNGEVISAKQRRIQM